MQLKLENRNIFNELFELTTITIIFLGITPLFNSGFDHDVVFWLLMLSSLLLIYYVIKNKYGIYIKLNDPGFLFILFVVWSLISFIWSINKVRTLIEFLQLVSYGIIFIVMRTLSDKEMYKVTRIVAISSSGVALLGILEYIFVIQSRILSTFPNPNPLGIYLVMIFLAMWGVYLKTHKKVLIIISLLMLTALVLTGSRGSYISLLLSLPFLFLSQSKKTIISATKETILCIGTSLLFAKLIMVIAPIIQKNANICHTLFGSMTRIDSFVPTSVTGRLEFWRVALKLVAHKPLHGFGLGTYFSAYYIEYGGNQWYSRFAHNHYLQTAVELGVIGLSLLIIFFITSYSKIITRIKNRDIPLYLPGTIAGSIAFLFHIGVDFSWNFPGSSIVFFAFLGISVGKSEYLYKRKGFYFNYKLVSTVLLAILILTVWQYSSNLIFVKGYEFSQKGDLVRGNYYYSLANRFYPFNSNGYMLESKNYMEMYSKDENKDYLERALQLAKRAVDLAPFDGSLHNHLGRVYAKNGNIEQAEIHLANAVKYGAYGLSNYIDLGKFYLDNHREKDAEKILLKGLEFIDIAKISVPENLLPIVYVESSILHHHLADYYSRVGKKDLFELHSEKEEEFVQEAFNTRN